MSKKRDFRCLMLETNDRRKFFTYEKNYDRLVEFSQVFGGNISVVEVHEADVLDLAQLVPAICNPMRRGRNDYKVISAKTRHKSVFARAKHIRNQIRKDFLSGKTVSLKDTHKRFSRYHLDLSTICNHIGIVRRELATEGVHVQKVGGGKYRTVPHEP